MRAVNNINPTREDNVKLERIQFPDSIVEVDNPQEEIESFESVYYLGSCIINGDTFACYHKDGSISIYYGKLNSGKY